MPYVSFKILFNSALEYVAAILLFFRFAKATMLSIGPGRYKAIMVATSINDVGLIKEIVFLIPTDSSWNKPMVLFFAIKLIAFLSSYGI